MKKLSTYNNRLNKENRFENIQMNYESTAETSLPNIPFSTNVFYVLTCAKSRGKWPNAQKPLVGNGIFGSAFLKFHFRIES